MRLSFTNFTGEVPKTLPTLLPDNAAQSAKDCDFSANVLLGMRQVKPEFTAPAGTRDLFTYGSKLDTTFAFLAESSVVRGPIADDAFDRFYWTDGKAMRVSSANWRGNSKTTAALPTRSYRVGVDAPAKAPKVSASASFEIDGVELSKWAVKAYCEDQDGKLSSGANVKEGRLTVDSVSAKDVKASASVSIACNVTAVALPAGFSDAGEFFVEKTSSTAVVPTIGPFGEVLYKASKAASSYIKESSFLGRKYRKTTTGDKFVTYYYLFNYKAWESLGKPTLDSGEFDPGFQLSDEGKPRAQIHSTDEATWRADATDYSAKLQYLGGGWFAQHWHGSVPKPTFTPNGLDISGVKDGDYSEPILVLTHNGKKITLRSDSNDSTFPAGIDGLHGSVDFTAGKVNVFIWKDAAVSYVTERAYVYTYVNDFGEEGPPSPPSSISVSEGMTVSVLPYLPAKGAWDDFVPIKAVRVYRTETGSSGTSFLFAKEISVAAAGAAWSDKLLGSQLGEALATLTYYPPPLNVKGLVAMPNGILAYFSSNKVYFSEPYLPYACNASNASQTLTDVVSMMPTDSGLYVTTKSYPYLIAGVSPETMVASRIPAIQAGTSLKSICDIGSYVVYASNDGLVALSGMSASLQLSQQFFTRETWRSRYGSRLSRMHLNAYDGHLLVWFSDGSPGFLMRFDDSAPYLTEMTYGAVAAYVNPLNDSLYLIQSDGGAADSRVCNFRGGVAGSCSWHSKDFIIPKPVNFGAVQMIGAGVVTLTIYADGAVKHTEKVALNSTDRVVKRLPSGFKARRWSFKLELLAGARLDEMHVAESPVEFADV